MDSIKTLQQRFNIRWDYNYKGDKLCQYLMRYFKYYIIFNFKVLLHIFDFLFYIIIAVQLSSRLFLFINIVFSITDWLS